MKSPLSIVSALVFASLISTACDGLVIEDEVGETTSALTFKRKPTRVDPPVPGVALVTASGGEITVINDLATEEPSGVLKKCSASNDCGASCSVDGPGGSCVASGTFVTCSFEYLCGPTLDGYCTSTQRVDCTPIE